MARAAREISKNGLYHIVFRGVNRQSIFEEISDYEKLRNILIELKKEMKYEIYAYCFMSNHVHIILKERAMGDISLIMKRILTKYSRWYNIKYQRCGALIANRYKSKPIDVDEYFLSVVRYIHQNPIKAKLVDNLAEYQWSSYIDYIKNKQGLTDKELVLGMLTKEEFIEFHKKEEKSIFIVDDRVKITDDEIRRKILKNVGVDPKLIGKMEKSRRNSILKTLKNEYSIRQLERVTGISRGIIHKS